MVYLEAALRTLCGCLPRPPPADINVPSEAIYADDTDFTSTDHEYLSKVNEIAPAALGEWFLYVNVDKTERTNIKREIDRVAEKWRMTKKLGSLLGDVEDLSRRKMLAVTAFRSLWSLWLRRQHVSERLRLRLYNAFVRPVLLYNAGTWGLTG